MKIHRIVLAALAILAFSSAGGTPPVPEQLATPDRGCGTSATLISAVQGAGPTSPMEDQQVVIEAVVTGVFTDKDDGLRGFYLEEEAGDRDNQDSTSEGLFVYAPDAVVEAGRTYRVAGRVTEFNGLTELTGTRELVDCGPGQLPDPATMPLPLANVDAPEALESMRVRFDGPLTVNGTYNLGRFGSLTLGSRRHYIPTHIARPGEDASLVETGNRRDRLILDDGSNRQNPALVPYPVPELSATRTVRAGDQVSELTAILDYRFDEWRLQPLEAPVFSHSNPRPPAPELTTTGTLVVASFNVLNYFNGDGRGGGFPTSRGADNADELKRQTAKLISAIVATGADVVGLMEIENDGYSDTSAIAQLASGLGTGWEYIDPGRSKLGSDEITVGFVYRKDRAEPVGAAATLTGAPFQNLNRQPLAQTFRPQGTDDGVTVAVNHFKSKGCGSARGPEADQGDGQGCWNPTRTRAARKLAQWLANDPTGTGEEDILIIGDLNSYAMEDPVMALDDRGYTDLLARFEGDTAYTYVFHGQAGYLDHALANEPLSAKVADATVWSINADEPRALDYNLEFKTAQHQAAYYSPDPWRSSDHDPVLVALALGTANRATDRQDEGPEEAPGHSR